MNEKRDDIQWLRALAVISVITFHLWPNLFYNGYLGVDIFFVISGYLMTYILSKKGLDFDNLKIFYFRRIKRIVPLYLLIIITTLLTGKFYLLDPFYISLKKEVLWATGFATNFDSLVKEKSYYEMITQFKFLLHTWSLGCEIQFYIIIPFLMSLFLYFNNSLVLISLFFVISFLFQSLNAIFGSENYAHYFLFSRIWQFLFGTFAYFYTKNFDYQPISSASESNDVEATDESLMGNKFLNKQIVCGSLLAVLIFLPLKVSNPEIQILLRLVVTFISGIIIVNNNDSCYGFPLSQYLNSVIVYIGNASYSLYLIHWPIIIYAKYYSWTYSNSSLIIIFCIIFVIAILIHELFEKILAKAENYISIIAIIFIYLCIGLLYFTPNMNIHSFNSNNATIEEIIAANIKLLNKDNLTFPCETDELIERLYKVPKVKLLDIRCSHTFIQNSVTKKEAVIMGNSYAEADFPGIAKALKILGFTKVYLFSRANCLPHGGEINRKMSEPPYFCDQWIGNFFSPFLAEMKPEIIFIVSRDTLFDELTKPLPEEGKNLLTTDFGTQQLNTYILQYANFCKELIIISPNPDVNLEQKTECYQKLKAKYHFTFTNILDVAKNLQNGKSLDEFTIPLQYIYEITHIPETRILAAISNCKNCKFFNTTKIFCNDNECPMYDKISQLGLWRDSAHLSIPGAEKLTQPLIEFLLN